MEKQPRSIEEPDAGNWWDEYPPEELLDIIITATHEPLPDMPVDAKRSMAIEKNTEAVNNVAEYIRRNFPNAPMRLFEAIGVVCSTLTPPQCTQLSTNPSVDSITPDAPLHAVDFASMEPV